MRRFVLFLLFLYTVLASTAVEHNSMLGKTLDVTILGKTQPFRLETSLGSGTFGHTFKAVSADKKYWLAVKVFSLDMSVVRLQMEIEILQTMGYFIDSDLNEEDDDRGYRWIAMRLFPGVSLSSYIEGAKRGISMADARKIQQALRNAFALVHLRGVQHNDVGASNIIIKEEYGEFRAWLIDFGFASLLTDLTPMARQVAAKNNFIAFKNIMTKIMDRVPF